MKEEYARGLFLYRPLRSIERDLASFASWLNRERPHTSLGLRTPHEVHRGQRPRPRRSLTRGALAVHFVAGDHRLPVLRLRHAA
jgi:hypothetical protein